MHFGPHNYIHGWKAVFDEQILAPRFGGLEPVTKAFFNMLGSKCLSSDGASPTTNGDPRRMKFQSHRSFERCR